MALAWTGALVALFALALWSLAVGVSDVSWNTLWSRHEDDMVAQVLMYARVPRTLALMLAGSAMAVAGHHRPAHREAETAKAHRG